MLTLQEISDRMEIGDLLHQYSAAIDLQQWDVMDQIFAADAHFDFAAMTGFEADTLHEFREWLRAGLTPMKGNYFHMSVPSQITVTGDTAAMVSTCFNPMTMNGVDVIFGHFYYDSLIRTDAGWRISRRELKPCFQHSEPHKTD